MAGRVIVPDYLRPDALAVPLFHFDSAETLAAMAEAASAHVGVLLIGPDGPALEAFARETGRPDQFAVLTAEYDSPWLRDRAPVAVREGDTVRQVLPRAEEQERPKDAALFAALLRGTPETVEVQLAGGNLVAGPGGVAVSTLRVLSDNGLSDADELAETARQLGVERWILTDAFPDDISAHTDCMVRFLSERLCAVVRREDRVELGEITDRLIWELTRSVEGLEVMEVPARATGERFDSPVNWVQLGRTVLIPRFGPEDPNCARTAGLLRVAGFDPVEIPCATKGLGGGLHCLTARIFG